MQIAYICSVYHNTCNGKEVRIEKYSASFSFIKNIYLYLLKNKYYVYQKLH